ncbi:MAG: hypothetical protein ACRCZB_07730, partial [Bacteroidales bacterium]
YTQNGQNFYIDNEGYIIQSYSAYAAFVPIVNGYINSPFTTKFKGDMFQFFKDQQQIDTLMVNIYQTAQLFDRDAFWRAQIQQIYITKDCNVEFIPRVGSHIICAGDFAKMDYKLQKLRTFYDRGIARRGWNAYTYIDLSFSNQVVAKRK